MTKVERLAQVDKMISDAMTWPDDHRRETMLADLERFKAQIQASANN